MIRLVIKSHLYGLDAINIEGIMKGEEVLRHRRSLCRSREIFQLLKNQI